MGGLAQPTPPGNGPEGFLTVINDALIVTEKVVPLCWNDGHKQGNADTREQIEWAFNLVQCLSFGTAKLSVVLFYRRIFRGQVFDIISKTMIAIVIAWMLSFFLAILFECGINYWALWSTLENLLAHCVDDTKIFKAFSISDVITDVLILSMPLYWVSTSCFQLMFGIHLVSDLESAYVLVEKVCCYRHLSPRGAVRMPRLQLHNKFQTKEMDRAIAAGIARLVIHIQQTTSECMDTSSIPRRADPGKRCIFKACGHQ